MAEVTILGYAQNLNAYLADFRGGLERVLEDLRGSRPPATPTPAAVDHNGVLGDFDRAIKTCQDCQSMMNELINIVRNDKLESAQQSGSVARNY